MRHLTLHRFWRQYRQLPREVQELADKSFELLKADPYHPSLHFKKIGGAKQLWSVRVGAHYRAPGVGKTRRHRVVLDRKPRRLRQDRAVMIRLLSSFALFRWMGISV